MHPSVFAQRGRAGGCTRHFVTDPAHFRHGHVTRQPIAFLQGSPRIPWGRLRTRRTRWMVHFAAVPRIPLLAGSRLVIANAEDDAVVLHPPAPRERIADVAAAVRDSLRFPLEGEPLSALVTRAGRATVVVEPPALPVPGSPADPRPAAIGA